MIDLPYPNPLIGTEVEQIRDLHEYIIRLREALEFFSTSIGSENFSETFQQQVETIQQMIILANDTAETAQMMAQKAGITIEDVISSSLFQNKLDELEENLKGYTDDAADEVEAKIPTKVSQITNDSGFITKTVNDLTNYYKKSETYTKTEVGNLISAIPKFAIVVVDELPTENISSTTVYLVPGEEEEGNLYEEFIYVNGAWELIGSQTVEIDLSNYYTKTEIGEMLSSYYTSSQVDGLIQTTEGKIPTVPKTLSSFTDDVGYAKESDIPTVPENVSAFTNDANYATTEQIPTVPTKVSAFANDSGYLKKSTQSLTYYYKKTETYTKSEVDALVEGAGGGGFTKETFSLPSGSWAETTDDTYKYSMVITTDKYTDDSNPVWMAEASFVGLPTLAQCKDMEAVKIAYFSSTGIALYATIKPTSDLTLVVLG